MRNNLHAGIVIDGNRRFAKKRSLPSQQGHEAGAKVLRNLFDWIKELKIKEVTIYTFSTENFKRSSKEVKYLMNMFVKEFSDLVNNEKIHKNKIKINFAGKKNLLSKKIQKIMKKVEDSTKSYSNFKVNFALAYGGREEILEAIKKLVKSGKQINEKNFQNNLWVKSDPDFIIRTGGDKRLSNFLPWQSSYSEFFFLKKTWPEFTKNDLKKVLQEFNKRQRRFGK